MSNKVTKDENQAWEMNSVSAVSQEVRAHNEATDGVHAILEKKHIHGQC